VKVSGAALAGAPRTIPARATTATIARITRTTKPFLQGMSLREQFLRQRLTVNPINALTIL
jgi:hypothetical protein